LANDPRAYRQSRKRDAHPLRQGIDLSTLPVIVYEEKQAKSLLPYLGVRHIVGGKPWDSYAKAHWVSELLKDSQTGFNIDDIKEMLGDSTGLIERLVSAYHVVRQLEQADRFDPKDSIKKGRGSADFPFSLIYNILDNATIRSWLKIPDSDKGIKPNPLPKDRLYDAADMVKMICGSKKEGFAPTINDSREIRSFARAIQDPLLFARLKKGEPLSTIQKETKQPFDRIVENFAGIVPLLEDSNTVVTSAELGSRNAEKLISTAERIDKLSRAILKSLKDMVSNK
jgi:hypothetical protein